MELSLSYTLLADGSSDRGLLPILTWMVGRHLPQCDIQSQWADFRRLRRTPRALRERIEKAVELYPCDLLFIHRDAEREPRASRVMEIANTLAMTAHREMPHVFVVPVRMTEAWLLFDEMALRRASGNPNGRVELAIPRLKDLEDCPDPKRILWELLILASELTGRRRNHIRLPQSQYLLAQGISDFSPLLNLPAFRAMDDEFRQVAEGMGWLPKPPDAE